MHTCKHSEKGLRESRLYFHPMKLRVYHKTLDTAITISYSSLKSCMHLPHKAQLRDSCMIEREYQ